MVAIIPPKLAVSELMRILMLENGDSRFPASKKLSDEAVLGESYLEPRLLCNDGRDR
jgi:hypothetical protein